MRALLDFYIFASVTHAFYTSQNRLAFICFPCVINYETRSLPLPDPSLCDQKAHHQNFPPLSCQTECPRLKRISILIPIPRLCLAASTNQSPSCNWKRQRPVRLEDSRLNCRRNTIYGSKRSRAKREERKGRLSRRSVAAARRYNFDIPSLSEGRYANDL